MFIVLGVDDNVGKNKRLGLTNWEVLVLFVLLFFILIENFTKIIQLIIDLF